MKTAIREIMIYLSLSDLEPEMSQILMDFFSVSSCHLKASLQMVLKKELEVAVHRPDCRIQVDDFREIDLSIDEGGSGSYLKIYIHMDFFRLFDRKLQEKSSIEILEKSLLALFSDPFWMHPDLRFFILSLGEKELAHLFYELQKRGLFTGYQILLVTIAFPDLSLTIKKCLSQNSVDDVMALKKNLGDMKISGRDLAGALYSVEEAIFFLMKERTDFEYSRFLKEIQKIISRAVSLQILLAKSFDTWIKDMLEGNLLHKTLSITDRLIVAKAVSSDPARYLALFRNQISLRKLEDIQSGAQREYPFDDILNAQTVLVKNFRGLRASESPPDYSSLEYLITAFSGPKDSVYLLQSVGWFILSTAMKTMRKKSFEKVLKHLPSGAVYLIEDVLRGIVNPNIIHDELQTRKAGSICARAILDLYRNGLVDLDI